MFPRTVTLYFAPDKQYIEGQIVELTPEMAEKDIRHAWWNHTDLKKEFGTPPPIDRQWNWNEMMIEYDGVELPSLKVALIAGERNAIQGAAMMSTQPVPSVLTPGEQCLLLELLFTAPWNRRNLRKDGKPYVVGVGTELLTWAAWLSRKNGFGGRLRLDSSPDQVGWYSDSKRGL